MLIRLAIAVAFLPVVFVGYLAGWTVEALRFGYRKGVEATRG